MSFFKKLGNGLYSVVRVVTPVIIATVKPEVLINTAVGAFVKHGTPISNQSIPYLNLGISSAIAYGKLVSSTGDWAGSIVPALQQGGLLAGLSTALHQSIKVPTQWAIQVNGKSL